MAVFITEGFESGLTGWSLTGTPTTGGPAAAHAGAAGLMIDTTAGAALQYIQKTIAVPTKVVVVQFYLWINTVPATSQNIFTAANANGQAKLVFVSNGALRVQSGVGVVQTSAVLSLFAWHRVDVRFNAQVADQASIDWQIDGVVQTQATAAQTALEYTNVRLGLQGLTTTRFYADDLLVGNAFADYPFTSPVEGAAISALGTGTSYQPDIKIAKYASLITGTGRTFVGVQSDLWAEAGAALGSGDAFEAFAANTAIVDAGVALGSGLSPQVGVSVVATAGVAAGTGTAYNTSLVSNVTAFAGAAQGSGVANGATTAVKMNAGNAAGVGQSYVPFFVDSTEGTALTVIMG